jgi:hypothetical protein
MSSVTEEGLYKMLRKVHISNCHATCNARSVALGFGDKMNGHLELCKKSWTLLDEYEAEHGIKD